MGWQDLWSSPLRCSKEVTASEHLEAWLTETQAWASELRTTLQVQIPQGLVLQFYMGLVRTCLGHLTLQASKEHSPAVPTEGDPELLSLDQ